MKRYSYALAYLIFLGLPAALIFTFVFKEINFYSLSLVTLFCLLVGGIFDIWAVQQGHRDKFYIWSYNNKTTLGKKLFGVPIEDYLLFLVLTPFLIIVAWEGAKKLVLNGLITTEVLAVGLLLTGISYVLIFHFSAPRKKRR